MDPSDKNHYLIELSESDRTDFGRVPFDEQEEEQKIFSAVWALESEVNNGGFSQYFGNSEGETAEFAPTALRRIGAERCASIVQKACRLLTSGPVPKDREERERLLSQLEEENDEPFEALDDAFYAYPDDLTALLFAFVQENPNVFGPTDES